MSAYNFIDMTGWVMSEHGVPDSRLTVVERAENNSVGQAQWVCVCNCPAHNQIITRGANIRSGNTKSCGCLEEEVRGKHFKKQNEYRIDGDVVVGKASNSDDEFFIDICDFDKIKDITWCVRTHKGVKALWGWDPEKKKMTNMHIILGFPNHDHIDRNELNNRRSNLRLATVQEQIWNRSKAKGMTSKVVGVSYDAKGKRWVAALSYNYKRIFRKYFDTEEEAILARLQVEAEYIPLEFAPNRHLYEQYNIIKGE